MGNFTAYLNSQIAFCLRYQKKTEEAVQAYRALKEQYPESPAAEDAQENIARTYYEAGNYEKAGPEFELLAENLFNEVERTNQAVGAITVPLENQKILYKNRQAALGYAAYCFDKSGHKVKAIKVLGSMKQMTITNMQEGKSRK